MVPAHNGALGIGIDLVGSAWTNTSKLAPRSLAQRQIGEGVVRTHGATETTTLAGKELTRPAVGARPAYFLVSIRLARCEHLRPPWPNQTQPIESHRMSA